MDVGYLQSNLGTLLSTAITETFVHQNTSTNATESKDPVKQIAQWLLNERAQRESQKARTAQESVQLQKDTELLENVAKNEELEKEAAANAKAQAQVKFEEMMKFLLTTFLSCRDADSSKSDEELFTEFFAYLQPFLPANVDYYVAEVDNEEQSSLRFIATNDSAAFMKDKRMNKAETEEEGEATSNGKGILFDLLQEDAADDSEESEEHNEEEPEAEEQDDQSTDVKDPVEEYQKDVNDHEQFINNIKEMIANMSAFLSSEHDINVNTLYESFINAILFKNYSHDSKTNEKIAKVISKKLKTFTKRPPKYLYFPSVFHGKDHQKIKFFRKPQTGQFFAIRLNFGSICNEKIFEEWKERVVAEEEKWKEAEEERLKQEEEEEAEVEAAEKEALENPPTEQENEVKDEENPEEETEEEIEEKKAKLEEKLRAQRRVERIKKRKEYKLSLQDQPEELKSARQSTLDLIKSEKFEQEIIQSIEKQSKNYFICFDSLNNNATFLDETRAMCTLFVDCLTEIFVQRDRVMARDNRARRNAFAQFLATVQGPNSEVEEGEENADALKEQHIEERKKLKAKLEEEQKTAQELANNIANSLAEAAAAAEATSANEESANEESAAPENPITPQPVSIPPIYTTNDDLNFLMLQSKILQNSFTDFCQYYSSFTVLPREKLDILAALLLVLSFPKSEIADDQFVSVHSKIRTIFQTQADTVIDRLTNLKPREFVLTEEIAKLLISWTTEKNEERPFLKQICELILAFRKVIKRQKKEQKEERRRVRQLQREEEERKARELEEAEANANREEEEEGDEDEDS